MPKIVVLHENACLPLDVFTEAQMIGSSRKKRRSIALKKEMRWVMSDHKKILEMQIINFVVSKILTVNND